jgi:CO/xanthine dehydrogenase Mo-binding subunit
MLWRRVTPADTGVVRLDRYTISDDFGSLINPRVALGQVHGGVAQGIGQSLLEHVVFDPSRANCSVAPSWTTRCRAL